MPPFCRADKLGTGFIGAQASNHLDAALYHRAYIRLMKSIKNIYFPALTLTTVLFALSWLPAPRLFDITCVLMILLFIPYALGMRNHDLRKNPLIRLGIVFFLYIVASIVWHRLTLPDYFPSTTSDRRFLRVLYFIAIAYAVAHSRFLTAWRLLGVAFAGLLIYLVIHFDSAEWLRAWQGERVDFGIHNAQHTGVVFATCTLAFIVFAPRFYRWVRSAPKAICCIGVFLWLAALLFTQWGVFVSQTRAVWLGLSITLLLSPLLLAWAHTIGGNSSLSLRRAMFGFIIAIAGFIALAAGLDVPEKVSDRLAQEQVTWESLRQAASHENQDLSSIEVRVASWSAAAGWIMERPFMGWGGRGSRPLIDESELFSEAFKETFNHLHNSYLQVLVEVGLIGALFILTLIILLGRATIRSLQQQSMPSDVFVFSWLFFAFWLVVNIFESYIIYPTGTYLVAIIAGFFYSFCIRRECQLPA